MRYLVMDRSTRFPGMAVFEDARLMFAHVWPGEPTRAPEWMADVQRLLAEREIAVDSLSGFVCGMGPGSFSGIRACLAALSGWALPGGNTVCGIASSAALALGLAKGRESITVVGDARRDRLWCVTYQVDAESACVRLDGGKDPSHGADDFQLVSSASIADAVPAGTRVVSSDWDRLEAVLRASFDATRLVQQAEFPQPAALGSLALANPASCVREPLPIYLHPAVALPGIHAAHH